MNSTENPIITFEWSPESSRFENYIALLADFKEKHGSCEVPRNYIVDGKKLGFWFSILQEARSQNRLSADLIKKLDHLGFVWKTQEFIITKNTKKIKFDLRKKIEKDIFIPIELNLITGEKALILRISKAGKVSIS